MHFTWPFSLLIFNLLEGKFHAVKFTSPSLQPHPPARRMPHIQGATQAITNKGHRSKACAEGSIWRKRDTAAGTAGTAVAVRVLRFSSQLTGCMQSMGLIQWHYSGIAMMILTHTIIYK